MLFVAACGSSGSPTTTPADAGEPVPFIEVLIAMTGSGCNEGGCHSPPTPAAGLDLVDDTHAELVRQNATGCAGRVLVVPGAPERSYLIDKLRGRRLCGERMPKGCDGTPARPCMGEERIALIEAWIRGGAQAE